MALLELLGLKRPRADEGAAQGAADGAAGDPAGAIGGDPASVKGLSDTVGAFPSLPDPIDVKIDILNHSNFLLSRVPGSAKCDAPLADFASGREPPAEIASSPGQANIEVIVKVPVIGIAFPNDADGEVSYTVPDAAKTNLRARWVRPVIGARRTVSEVKPPNPNYTWNGDFVGDRFTFTFTAAGSGPNPNPNPNPQPSAAATSCLVTIVNKTKSTITLLRQLPQKGDFVDSPESSLAPGASTHFVYAAVPNAKAGEEGCSGLLAWDVGSPGKAVWRVEWDNPSGAKNTATSTLDPATAGFRSLDQIGQGEENVPVTFTLFDQGGSGPAPKPEQPEPEFKPPAEEKQPTLRRGDKSADGWIEYMQELLRDAGFPLDIDGDYGPATEKAVKGFQKAKGLQVDGTCGNETWSVLREGPREDVGTDGRKPHTFVDKGLKARWQREGEHCVLIGDEGRLLVNSVGDVPDIDKKKATVRVTPPGTKAKVVEIELGEANQRMPDNQGNVYIVKLRDFRKTFPIGDREPTDDEIKLYVIEAYLEQSLGGDFIKTSIVAI
jgi:peptidoglycan hydrolase-like protein with peptidoglycan-binding domain